MKIPEKIRIGGLDVDVEIVYNIAVASGGYSPRELKIYLDEALVKRHGEILMHEIIKALCDAYNLDIEHHDVMILGRGLYQVLKENNIDFREGLHENS